MSNMKNNLIREDREEEKEIEKDNNLSKSQLENIDSCRPEDEGKKPEDETDHKEEEEEEEEEFKIVGESEVAEDDDGFKTPTSLDQKIPAMTQCPPAPKKIRPEPSLKRKASPPTFDISDAEVESIFSPISKDLKFKKPRRDDDDED